jgi:transposase
MLLGRFFLLDVACLLSLVRQFLCTHCNKWKEVRHKHGSVCTHCIWEQEQLKHHPPLPPSPAPSLSPPPSMFGRPEGCIDQLTLIERAAIVTLHQLGWTHINIAQEIHCSENTVTLWVHRWQQQHSLGDAERSGRPRCTTERTDERIEAFADEKVSVTPKDIVRELELPVSARTVRRGLDEVGLFGRVQQEEHAYTDENIRRRISFAEGYSHWTEDDWSRVIFSDETHFYLGQHGRQYVQRPVGTALDPKYTLKTERLEGKVSLWGCICSGGLGHAELYVDSLDARRYQSILALNLVSSARQFWPNEHWWYQQDNWTVHTAGTSQVWFHNHGIDLIDWPAWSPDLNPIENLWNDLKRRVYVHHPQTMEELENWIGMEWQATDLNFISHICRSMPHRLQLLRANHGHKISY